jgi:hypothetical protein
MSVIELTRFTVRAKNTQAMLDARAGMIKAFRQGARHFDLIDPSHPSWAVVCEWLAKRLA